MTSWFSFLIFLLVFIITYLILLSINLDARLKGLEKKHAELRREVNENKHTCNCGGNCKANHEHPKEKRC